MSSNGRPPGRVGAAREARRGGWGMMIFRTVSQSNQNRPNRLNCALGIAGLILPPAGGAGGRPNRPGGGWGVVRQKGSRVGEAQLANLRIYPPQSLALFWVD